MVINAVISGWFMVINAVISGWFMVINAVINGWFMVINATFNNISAISWRSVLLVEETGVPRENHRPVASR
jgi:hypothetical protein